VQRWITYRRRLAIGGSFSLIRTGIDCCPDPETAKRPNVRFAVLANNAVLFICLLWMIMPCGCSPDHGTGESLVPERFQGTRLWETAPVPNRDATLPPSRERVSVAPAIVHPFGKPLGNGYLPGSTYRNQEDTPSTRGPGLEIRVPVP
jgi:hypothetical protein